MRLAFFLTQVEEKVWSTHCFEISDELDAYDHYWMTLTLLLIMNYAFKVGIDNKSEKEIKVSIQESKKIF